MCSKVMWGAKKKTSRLGLFVEEEPRCEYVRQWPSEELGDSGDGGVGLKRVDQRRATKS